MSVILSSLLGFAASSISPILSFLKDSQDKKHELDMMDKQIQMQKELQTQKIEASLVESENLSNKALYESIKPSSIGWVEAVNSMVRPIITSIFVAMWCSVKISLLTVYLTTPDMSMADALVSIWDETTDGIFAAIITFWFGSREFSRRATK